jgi:hypothetical protein
VVSVTGVDLAHLRRLLHDIVVSEIDGKWDLFWAQAKMYLRKVGLRGILDYRVVFRRVEFNAEGRPPFIDVFAILANERCSNIVPVGVEVKVTDAIDAGQVGKEVELIPRFMAGDYRRRYGFLASLRSHCSGGAPMLSNRRVFILIAPGVVVKRVDELIKARKGELARVDSYYEEDKFKHVVIPLEQVLEWLGVRRDLEEVLGDWDLVALRRFPEGPW